MSEQLDGALVTLLVQIGGYKELIINYIRMYALTEDDNYLKNAGDISKAMIKAEEEMHRYVKKNYKLSWLLKWQRG
ncbi:MAG: hypothetical protein ACYC21_09725 [Eubacteriales bacterium]